jgi:hypothetical protein
VSAREKAESFASINSKLGLVQKGALTEAIRAAYAQRADSAAPYPDFHDVYRMVAAMYEADNKKDDSPRCCGTSRILICSGGMEAMWPPSTGFPIEHC